MNLEQLELEAARHGCRIVRTRGSTPTANAAWLKEAHLIMAEVCERHGVTLGAMLGVCREDWISHPRQEAMAQVRAETPLSYPQIAAVFNRKDHTTIIFGVKAHARRMRQGGCIVPQNQGANSSG